MRVLDVSDDLGASFRTFVERVGVENLPETIKTAAWREPSAARDRDFAALEAIADVGTYTPAAPARNVGLDLVDVDHVEIR